MAYEQKNGSTPKITRWNRSLFIHELGKNDVASSETYFTKQVYIFGVFTHFTLFF